MHPGMSPHPRLRKGILGQANSGDFFLLVGIDLGTGRCCNSRALGGKEVSREAEVKTLLCLFVLPQRAVMSEAAAAFL